MSACWWWAYRARGPRAPGCDIYLWPLACGCPFEDSTLPAERMKADSQESGEGQDEVNIWSPLIGGEGRALHRWGDRRRVADVPELEELEIMPSRVTV